jgi:hypothetical protein
MQNVTVMAMIDVMTPELEILPEVYHSPLSD